jgi:predicted XRE-type DNA-binding protein
VNEPVYNVFEALECENPDLLMAKAQLSVKILRAIDARQISNAAVARLARCTLQRIKQFRANDLDDFSLEELFDMLKALGQDISITVQPAAEPTAHLRVAGV